MSFAAWPASAPVSPHQLASAGFYYIGNGDEVRCAFCKVEIMRWQHGDDPLSDHRRWAPQCKFVQELMCNSDSDAAAAAASNDECGHRDSTKDAGDSPKHPAFNSYNARIKTYENLWPRGLSQTPHQLASAGFFYTGVGDNVVCFHDDCRLSGWASSEDPWREHARWFANCPYVRKVKGFEYVQRTSTEACSISETTTTTTKNNIKTAVESSTAELDDELLCKICFQNRRDVCFMPCGHVVSCRECAISVDRCPLCRDKFISIQRLFYA